jgi:hypothetical protein
LFLSRSSKYEAKTDRVKASGNAWHYRGEFTADFDESKAASASFENF